MDSNGGQLLPGDTVEYTITATSGEGDPAANVVVTDAVPAGLTFAPGSLRVLSGPNAGAKTGTAGDDQAEYLVGASPSVRFRLGTGADDATGGTLPAGATSSVRFSATVDAGVANGQVISNVARVAYTPSGNDDARSAQSTPVDTRVTVTSDRSITKTANPPIAQDGGALTYTLTARNAGPSTDPAVVVTDTLPAGFTPGTVTASQGTCTLTGRDVTCDVGAVVAGGSATVAIAGTAAGPTGTGPQAVVNTARVRGANDDTAAGNDTATLTTPVNRPPTAVDDTAAVTDQTSVVVEVLANDGPDPDGDPVTVNISGPPTNGAASVDADGQVTYTPNAAFRGTDTFTYSLTDGRGGSSSATVSVTVPNKNPDANDDATSVAANGSVAIPVLDNDTDLNGDQLTIASFMQPSRGTVTQDGAELVFTDAGGGPATVTFAYTVADGAGGTASATVTVTIAGVEPVAADDTSATASGTPVTVPVLDNDTNAGGGTLVVGGVTQPPAGQGEVTTNGTTVTYTPAQGFRGDATFTYTATSAGGSATANVTVTVANADPVARDDTLAVAAGTPGTLDPRANDTDANGDALTVVGVTQPSRGTAAITGDGTVAYTPDAGFKGTDTFAYTVADGLGGTATAQITVVVANAPPTAVDDDDELTVIGTGTTSGDGGLVLGAGGLDYTRAPTFKGVDLFTYTISDGDGGTDTASVAVTVPNAPPIAQDIETSTATGSPVPINVTAAVSDPNGDDLTVAVASGPDKGTAEIALANEIVYVPPPTFRGVVTFTYSVDDGDGGTATATVTVTVANAVPEARDDQAETTVDTPVAIPVLANDRDLNSDPLTVTLTEPPTAAQGDAVVEPDGRITFIPAPGFVGLATFTYAVTDPLGASDTATVTVTVTQEPDPEPPPTEPTPTEPPTPAPSPRPSPTAPSPTTPGASAPAQPTLPPSETAPPTAAPAEPVRPGPSTPPLTPGAPTPAPGGPLIDRVDGPGRIETAVEIARPASPIRRRP